MSSKKNKSYTNKKKSLPQKKVQPDSEGGAFEEKEGIILKGINNIFTVLPGTDPNSPLKKNAYTVECRLKGKILDRDKTTYHNPLAAGDRVLFEEKDDESKEGIISRRLKRDNFLSRKNIKRQRPQIIAANIDLLLIITSPKLPPFRPRFIDRVIISAEKEGVKPVILLNKCDQNISERTEERLALYETLGYRVLRASALSDQKESNGMEQLLSFLKGKTVAFFGQSGVGKSTLINKIVGDARQVVCEISEKYARGRHTTNHSFLIRGEDFSVIDTPGVRDFVLHDIKPEEVAEFFPEFTPFEGMCPFSGCTHTHEPKCAVKQGCEEGLIHPDRYESYIRIVDGLKN